MYEEDFIVVTARDGDNVKTNASIEAVVTKMGCQSFNDRALGGVTAIVTKVDGKISKNKLNWRDDSSPEFLANQKENANALLAAVLAAVEGGGDNGDLKVKVRTKM